mmetsp:Transcript_576/g.1949  ORF Transcript_576/g.1949 Transcript_576/m.1949 type:complete len:210 (+) Transcript_576:961-1590(+)
MLDPLSHLFDEACRFMPHDHGALDLCISNFSILVVVEVRCTDSDLLDIDFHLPPARLGHLHLINPQVLDVVQDGADILSLVLSHLFSAKARCAHTFLVSSRSSHSPLLPLSKKQKQSHLSPLRLRTHCRCHSSPFNPSRSARTGLHPAAAPKKISPWARIRGIRDPLLRYFRYPAASSFTFRRRQSRQRCGPNELLTVPRSMLINQSPP